MFLSKVSWTPDYADGPSVCKAWLTDVQWKGFYKFKNKIIEEIEGVDSLSIFGLWTCHLKGHFTPK